MRLINNIFGSKYDLELARLWKLRQALEPIVSREIRLDELVEDTMIEAISIIGQRLTALETKDESRIR
jgi:hypothetical protein